MSAAQFKVTFQQVNLGINLVEHAGCVVVSFVFPSSEALAQGVQVGDIVLDIAGVSVQSAGAPGAKDKAEGHIAQCARPVTMSFQRVAGSGASLPPGPAIAPPVPAVMDPGAHLVGADPEHMDNYSPLKGVRDTPRVSFDEAMAATG
jgi:hypothetical protein